MVFRLIELTIATNIMIMLTGCESLSWEGFNIDQTYDPYEGMVLVCEGTSRENADCEYVDQEEMQRVFDQLRGIRL